MHGRIAQASCADGFFGIGKGTRELAFARGRVRVVHRRHGRVLAAFIVPNLITDPGKASAAKLLGGVGSEPPFQWIALGTGTTAPDASDTALEAEITGSGLARAQGNVSTNENVLTVTHTWNVTGSVAVTEAGLFNASSGGTMYARTTFAVINVQDGDTITFTWQVTMT